MLTRGLEVLNLRLYKELAQIEKVKITVFVTNKEKFLIIYLFKNLSY